jgi:hypothetical protein
LVPHVTFIHGIGNKIEAGALELSWVDALRDGGGPDLPAEGVSTSLCYWADVLYAEPLSPTQAAAEANDDVDLMAVEVVAEPWFQKLPPAEQKEVLDLAAEVGAISWITDGGEGGADSAAPVDSSDPEARKVDFERVPLPGPIKKMVMEDFLRDVHHYLWNAEFTPRSGERYAVRTEIRRRAVDTLTAAAAAEPPHVVVAHSLGSVVAYDVLQNVARTPAVDGLLTVGSPLGLDEVQDRLDPGWSRWDGFPAGRVRDRWVNVYDRLDPVCGFDPVLANDFRRAGQRAVIDVHEANWGRWRHSIGKYLRRPLLRERLVDLLEL